MSRKVDHPLYRSVNGGWFETSALYEDGLRNTGFFSKVDIATPGCLVVFPDKITKSGKKTEGHVGIAVAASGAGVDGITKVVHCSSGNYKRHKDAVRVTGPEIWSTRSDSLIIEYVGVTG